MKKLLMLFLLFSLCVKMSGERVKNMSVSFDRNDFSILVTNNIAHISPIKFLYSYGNDFSCPALPKICVNLLIGPNEELADFSYTKTEQKILDDIFIAPCPKAVPTNTSVKQSVDTIVSYTQATYPQTFVSYIGSHYINGYKILSFDICPFRYDNVNQTLYLEQNFTFNISLQSNALTRNVEIRQNDETLINDLIVNPEDISLYDDYRVPNRQEQRTSQQYEYAIITNNNLKPTFQKLANWKTLKGVRTTVLTVEDIYAAYPNTFSQQMKIKETLKSLYDNNTDFKYALLGGDVNVVPAQMCHIEAHEDIIYADDCPTDYFYACFGTMDWDPNHDGRVGELSDSVDISPNIAITRAPVRTIDDAEVFVNRIIAYESAPNIQTWANNILMGGYKIEGIYNYSDVLIDDPRMYDMYESGDTIISDTHYKGERLYRYYISSYLNADSVSKVKFYDTGTDFPGGANYNFNPKNIQKELSKGYTFVNIDTHGNYSGWETEGSGYTVSYADTLNNSNHTIIITSACHTNAFDKNTKCLSEAFIRNPNSGIIAYFGCSREGWDDLDFTSLGTSAITNIYLYRTIFSEPNKNFGEMVRKAKSILPYCDTYDKTYRWLLFGLNPIGDPEMPIYTRRPKKFTNVSISFSNGSLSINTGVDDCKICVASANDIGASYYDVRTGNSASYSNLTDEYSICITKQGYVPYIARCGNTVYLQNESVNTDYEVFSNQTFAGSNVTTDKPNGPVEVNKGNTIINGTNGVTINDSFEVKYGASLEIRTN